MRGRRYLSNVRHVEPRAQRVHPTPNERSIVPKCASRYTRAAGHAGAGGGAYGRLLPAGLVGQPEQELPVTAPSLAVAERGQIVAADPAVVEGDLFGDRDALVLAFLHGLDEAGRFHEAVVRPGVEPGESSSKRLHVQVRRAPDSGRSRR